MAVRTRSAARSSFVAHIVLDASWGSRSVPGAVRKGCVTGDKDVKTFPHCVVETGNGAKVCCCLLRVLIWFVRCYCMAQLSKLVGVAYVVTEYRENSVRGDSSVGGTLINAPREAMLVETGLCPVRRVAVSLWMGKLEKFFGKLLVV